LKRIAALLHEARAALADSSESPRSDAYLLLESVLGRKREWLLAHDEAEATDEEVRSFEACCDRRRLGEPVAYIIGTMYFYGREFVVNESVLLPRPETEHLIDEAIAFIRAPVRVLDVGAGCGAIACTIAAETKAIVDGTDISANALEVANENARRLGVGGRVSFYEGHLIEPVRNNRYDVVIANLPYIPTNDLPKLPDPASFEPREALDGGVDGLTLYEQLLPQLPPLVTGRSLILLECAPPTIGSLGRIARFAFPNAAVAEVTDYAGLGRYVKICP
jgi:release factor glutamine methyltransferase